MQKSLDAKTQAQQAAEQQKSQLQQAAVKADRDVAQATGLANAMKQQAESEAQASLTKAKAQAQAQANELLVQSVTAPLIQHEQLRRWDGRLPMFPGATGTPLINVETTIEAAAQGAPVHTPARPAPSPAP